MNTQYLDYTDGEITCEAYVAYDEFWTSKRPCVLVSHQWGGQSDVERKKAEELARLGYVGFGIDIRQGRSGRVVGRQHPPNLGEQAPITAKVLILHGYDDPMAAPEHVLAIARELTEAKADWQLHAYGHAMHAFTAEGVDLPERGLKYNAAATRRSRTAMKDFLEESLA